MRVNRWVALALVLGLTLTFPACATTGTHTTVEGARSGAPGDSIELDMARVSTRTDGVLRLLNHYEHPFLWDSESYTMLMFDADRNYLLVQVATDAIDAEPKAGDFFSLQGRLVQGPDPLPARVDSLVRWRPFLAPLLEGADQLMVRANSLHAIDAPDEDWTRKHTALTDARGGEPGDLIELEEEGVRISGPARKWERVYPGTCAADGTGPYHYPFARDEVYAPGRQTGEGFDYYIFDVADAEGHGIGFPVVVPAGGIDIALDNVRVAETGSLDEVFPHISVRFVQGEIIFAEVLPDLFTPDARVAIRADVVEVDAIEERHHTGPCFRL